MKKKWKSAIRHQQQQICNSLRVANHYELSGGSSIVHEIDNDFPYDNVSQSSYGSHKNRNFESRSHRGSGEDLRNQEEAEKLALLMMNGGNGKQKNGGILTKAGTGTNMERPQRSVVIDDEDIDAYSPDYDMEEDETEDEEEIDKGGSLGILDEEEARMRYEVFF